MSRPCVRPAALVGLSLLVGGGLFCLLAPAPASAQTSREEHERRRRALEREQDDDPGDPIVIERSFGSEQIDRALQTPQGRTLSHGLSSDHTAQDDSTGARESAGIDWPEWRGRGRRGMWDETRTLESFPANGLDVAWRTPIGAGSAGPAVAEGRVYVSDFVPDPGGGGVRGHERLHGIDAASGKVLWTNSWPVDYSGLEDSALARGPRATPTVDHGRVYVVGATGVLRCVAARTGRLIWAKDFARDFGARIPIWGLASAPLVDGDHLIAIVSGAPNAMVVAFDKRTGDERWRAARSGSAPGWGQPLMIDAGGVRQLIAWHPMALSALDPETGAFYWDARWGGAAGLGTVTPVQAGAYLLAAQLDRGSLMMRLDRGGPDAMPLWQLHPGRPEQAENPGVAISTPAISGNYVYGVDGQGRLRCLDARDGHAMWQTDRLVRPGQWATAFIVKHGNRYFVNTDQGDLVIARFSPNGYQELDRTRLIAPTTDPEPPGSRGHGPAPRLVNWSHPAYAYRHVFARNDSEILSASLALPEKGS